MKRSRKRLPLPQHEFGFARETFNLIAEPTLDGERIARECAESARARKVAESRQEALLSAKRL